MFLNGTHVMIDIETLSTRSNAQVLQTGVVVFDHELIYTEDSRTLRLEQQKHRHVSTETLKFWLQLNPVKLHSLMEGEDYVESFHDYLCGIKVRHKPVGWWAHSPSFDLMILEDLFRNFRRDPPWDHRSMYDTRTLSMLMGKKMVRAAEKDQHDALSDARAQARWVMSMSAEHKS